MVLFVTPAPGWGWADDYFWLCVGAYSSDWSSANCRNIRSLDTHPRPLHLAQSLNDSANGALTHQTQFESFVGFCLSRPLLQPFGIKRLAAFPQRQSSGRQLSRYSQARQTRHHPLRHPLLIGCFERTPMAGTVGCVLEDPLQHVVMITIQAPRRYRSPTATAAKDSLQAHQISVRSSIKVCWGGKRSLDFCVGF